MRGLLSFFLFFGFLSLSFAQPIGNTYVAGTTWYDLQHIGSCGRMITLDEEGNAHMVWMNGLDSALTQRHVYYNWWSEAIQSFQYEGGVQIDAESRAGYATITVTPQGCPISAYHALNAGESNPHTDISLCEVGGFIIPYFHPDGDNFAAISTYPIIARSIDGNIHVISEGSDILDDPFRVYYSRGTPLFDSDGLPLGVQWSDYDNSGFLVTDTTFTIANEVACSRTTERIALGWSDNRTDSSIYNNDIYIQTSEDGGLNFELKRNITDFAVTDTFRVFDDLNLLFDQSDHIHAAFTTIGYNEALDSTSAIQSMIYHWNELTEQFSLIANGWVNSRSLGVWQTNIQRPSLAIDESNGYLYCAYMRYDTSTFTAAGFASADVWISVSTNNGSSWSVGTNVTRTTPQGHPVPQGESLHEREPTLAEKVEHGFLHLTYLLDHEAGASVSSEGITTLNEFIYQRIPVDSIPTTPILPNYPLHWDSTGFLGISEHPNSSIAKNFELYPAYPNPFNPSTQISFDLPKISNIELKVFDVLGRTVEVLRSGRTEAGHHEVLWNASRYSSGIYFVNLKAEKQFRTQKIIYLK